MKVDTIDGEFPPPVFPSITTTIVLNGEEVSYLKSILYWGIDWYGSDKVGEFAKDLYMNLPNRVPSFFKPENPAPIKVFKKV